MSFDAFVQFYNGGEPFGVFVLDIQAAFGPYVTLIDTTHWRLCYDARNRSDMYLDAGPEPGTSVGFTINRPCADSRLWNSLVNILRIGNGVLFFPGGVGPLVASIDAIPHLPPEMVETLGAAMVVNSGQHILDQVYATSTAS